MAKQDVRIVGPYGTITIEDYDMIQEGDQWAFASLLRVTKKDGKLLCFRDWHYYAIEIKEEV